MADRNPSQDPAAATHGADASAAATTSSTSAIVPAAGHTSSDARVLEKVVHEPAAPGAANMAAPEPRTASTAHFVSHPISAAVPKVEEPDASRTSSLLVHVGHSPVTANTVALPRTSGAMRSLGSDTALQYVPQYHYTAMNPIRAYSPVMPIPIGGRPVPMITYCGRGEERAEDELEEDASEGKGEVAYTTEIHRFNLFAPL
ncbi:hypothetical protein GGF32_004392 [Allomyces javanicus]|nr:hypothetical protein GGF32_004392 [Allomyces javanicus]